ncbi:MAG: cupin domain-containing protein [Gammaproteobacteria bacterium]
MNEPDQIIHALKLTPHPEGGHFVETFRDNDGHASLIFYLLKNGETSHWHRLTKNEILHFYDGDPMRIYLSSDGNKVSTVTLGRELDRGHEYHCVVPPGTWFSMESTGNYSLIGCTVSPAFSFDDFELAPVQWQPGNLD